MKFYVYQNNKPAVIRTSTKLWANNIFNTKREAEIYAYLWAYLKTRQQAEIEAPEMELNRQYDYTSWNCDSVFMMISNKEEL